MNVADVIVEIEELKAEIGKRQSARMNYDLTEGVVTIEQLTLPEGWENKHGTRHADMRFDLDETYPRSQPTVYISSDIRYEGTSPHVLYARSSAPPGFVKYCIHTLSDWDPQEHDLVTMFRILEVSLENPHSDNPLVEA
ncbi:hypothetical protein [Halopiger aswanensis]|uniref:UBC core domain-containing protein n=1 Tax=Halopiger aswanensis TaxID=148449 RepID=A0A3R7EBN9_9EURY|nr:hypothetical protein [Halopiger aswanensis]RKD86232.1 hypothetical protein ATJ93_4649 [Halopiger aswanensis]